MLLLWLSINRNIAFEFFNYLNNNEKLTTFIIVELLEDNNYIFDKNKLIILPTDIALAIGMVESSHDEDKKNVLINIRKLFTKNKYKEYTQADKYYTLLQNDQSYENAINYIVAFVEEYNGKKGYYEFFNSKHVAVKTHYNEQYYNFKLNISKTMSSKNILYFDVSAEAYIELPFVFNNRNKMIIELYDEIKRRSYKDVISSLMNILKNKIKPYFDLTSIKLEFNVDWKLNIDTNFYE